MTIKNIENKFIAEPLLKARMREFLDKKLERAGISNIEIQRTPLFTKIMIECLNPGYVIGAKGRRSNELTDEIKKLFDIENPQISVIEVQNPSIEPRLVGKKAAKYIEMGKRLRPVMQRLLKSMLDAGALGGEIVASGKLGGKGAKSRAVKVSAGYLPKAGQVTESVKEALVEAHTKAGIIGIRVRVVPPGTKFPDKEVKKIDLPKTIAKSKENSEKEGGEL
ncbi:MAG: 30S ribosomal protein S3 [Candidatus Anstonellales archaeon]